MADRLPAITPLQFLVLGLVRSGEQPGRFIRHVLADQGARRSAPAFYQLMARLERDGLVEGRYHPIAVGDQAVNERRYRITPAGASAWTRTRTFYAGSALTRARKRWSHA
jgi:DNA-binding PadR family transcriptional regulator